MTRTPQHQRLFFYDLKTTGFSPERNGIYGLSGYVAEVSEAAILYIIDHIEFSCSPGASDQIAPYLAEKGIITDDELFAFPPREVIHNATFLPFLRRQIDQRDRADKLLCITYHGYPNRPFLQNWFRKNNDDWFRAFFHHKGIEVLNLALDDLQEDLIRLKREDKLPDFKLKTIAEHYKLELSSKDSDTELTIRLYAALKGLDIVDERDYELQQEEGS